MSKGNVTESDFIAFVFNNTAMPSYGSNLYVALYTGDPGEAGAPNTNETAYTNYARQAVIRSAAGWTVSGSSASNTALISFPQCGATPGASITYVAIVTSASGGTGQILYSGILGTVEAPTPLAISQGVQPQFAIGQLVLSED